MRGCACEGRPSLEAADGAPLGGFLRGRARPSAVHPAGGLCTCVTGSASVCARVCVRVRECFGLAGKMADGSGPSRPDWRGEEEENEGSGRGVPPLHPCGSRPRARDGPGEGGSARPFTPPRTPSACST